MIFTQCTEIKKRNYAIIFFVIVGATFGIYSGSFKNEFIDYWDDNTYVTANELIKNLNFKSLKLIFTSFYFTDFYPLNITSYAIDYHFWGLNPMGYHITNVFIHSLNASLIFLIIMSIRKSFLIASITTIIFIVHPTNVESVAWIAERKNVLSFFFYLLAFYLYVKYQNNKKFYCYLISLVIYILAVFSKTTVIMLPFLLLLYDFCFTKKNLKEKIVDKIPFLAISCLGAITTMAVFRDIENFSNYYVDLYFRLLTIPKALVSYIAKFFVPINLSNMYHYDVCTSFTDWDVIIPVFILALVAYFVYKSFKKNIVIFFCALWIFINLVHVLNIIPGPHWLADRYLYYPSLAYGLFVATVFSSVLNKINSNRDYLRLKNILVLSAIVIILCFYAFGTTKRISVWNNSVTLWEDCVKKNPKSALARTYLGSSYLKRDLKSKAYPEFAESLKIFPGRSNAWANLAYMEIDAGQLDEALKKIKLALFYEGNNYEAHNALGLFYMYKGRAKMAIIEFKRALELCPESIIDFAHIYNFLGVAYQKIGQIQDSINSFEKSLEFVPNDYGTISNLAMTYAFYVNNKEMAMFYYNKMQSLGVDHEKTELIREKISHMESH